MSTMEQEVADHLGTTTTPFRTMIRWLPPSSGASPLLRVEGNGSLPLDECSPSLQKKLPSTPAIAHGPRSPSPSVGPTSGQTYRTTRIWYHAILGRPAVAKFMAIPHYAYLVLKMPSPVGVLALQANLSVTYACETESLALAEATDLSI